MTIQKMMDEADARIRTEIDSMPEGKAAVFKIYAENGNLAAILFIGAASSADVWLPGGSYQIKAGIGEAW